MELLHGAEISARPVEHRREVERFAARVEVAPFDDEAAAHAANIRATLLRKSQLIGGYDLLIAGHARSRGLVVVTGNLREFTHVEGLRRGLAGKDKGWAERLRSPSIEDGAQQRMGFALLSPSYNVTFTERVIRILDCKNSSIARKTQRIAAESASMLARRICGGW